MTFPVISDGTLNGGGQYKVVQGEINTEKHLYKTLVHALTNQLECALNEAAG